MGERATHRPRLIIRQLAANIFTDYEDQLAAEEIVKEIIKTGRRVPCTGHNSA